MTIHTKSKIDMGVCKFAFEKKDLTKLLNFMQVGSTSSLADLQITTMYEETSGKWVELFPGQSNYQQLLPYGFTYALQGNNLVVNYFGQGVCTTNHEYEPPYPIGGDKSVIIKIIKRNYALQYFDVNIFARQELIKWFNALVDQLKVPLSSLPASFKFNPPD